MQTATIFGHIPRCHRKKTPWLWLLCPSFGSNRNTFDAIAAFRNLTDRSKMSSRQLPMSQDSLPWSFQQMTRSTADQITPDSTWYHCRWDQSQLTPPRKLGWNGTRTQHSICREDPFVRYHVSTQELLMAKHGKRLRSQAPSNGLHAAAKHWVYNLPMSLHQNKLLMASFSI